MGHGHRRSALSDESMSAFPDYTFADTEAQAAEERDAIEFLIDDYGNAIWMDERPRRIKMPEQAEPVLEHPIGYVECPTDHEPDPREMVDGVYDPGANEVTESTLQRGTGGETYTTVDGKVRKKGGSGSNSVGVAKEMPPMKGAIPNLDDEYERPPVVELGVYGLTIGEIEFYHNRRGTAREVLRGAAAAILRGETLLISAVREAKEVRERRAKHRKANFQVYGLEEIQAFALRQFPGSARAALSAYARERDGARIERREAAQEETAA